LNTDLDAPAGSWSSSIIIDETQYQLVFTGRNQWNFGYLLFFLFTVPMTHCGGCVIRLSNYRNCLCKSKKGVGGRRDSFEHSKWGVEYMWTIGIGRRAKSL